jgi:hypothetical protein
MSVVQCVMSNDLVSSRYYSLHLLSWHSPEKIEKNTKNLWLVGSPAKFESSVLPKTVALRLFGMFEIRSFHGEEG